MAELYTRQRIGNYRTLKLAKRYYGDLPSSPPTITMADSWAGKTPQGRVLNVLDT